MSATEAGTLGIKMIGTPHAPGSVQCDWIVAHANGASADSAATLYFPGGTAVSTNVQSINIPIGASVALIRQRLSSNATVGATMSVVRSYGLDSNNIPTRLDSTAGSATAAGQSLLFHTTESVNLFDATYMYSPPITLTGLDMLGDAKLRVMVETASDHTASVNQILVKFIN